MQDSFFSTDNLDNRLTDSPLKFIKVWGFASIIGTSPIRPAKGKQLSQMGTYF